VDFAFSDDQALLRATTRRFLDDHESLAIVRQRMESPHSFVPAVWVQGAALGWTAMLVPEHHGGGSVTDQPLIDLVALAEQLGWSLNPGPFLPTNVVADALARFGTDQQAKEYLPRIASGEMTAAWCLSGDGTPEFEAIGVVAVRRDDSWQLDGVARYVHGAFVAGLLLVAARNGDDVVVALVPRPCTGVSDRAMGALDLTRRMSEVHFDSVNVADAMVLGGPEVLDRALVLATVLQCAEAVGAAEHLFETTLQYAKDRIQFGRAIGSFQAIKHRLADLAMEVEAMRAATHYAALAVSDDLIDAAEAVATAGAYVTDAFAHLCGEALQIHGGIGFTWEHDVHLYLRRAKTDQVLYGDSAWHRERLCQLLEAATPTDERATNARG
jgi:alkylation response protein AidB-like acyl-CoA dehydrogenase